MRRSPRRSYGSVTYDGTLLCFHVHFRLPLRVDLKDRVKSIPGSRWDGARKSWFVPHDHARLLLKALHGVAFDVDEPTREKFREAAADAGESADENTWQTAPERTAVLAAPILQEAAAYRARQTQLPIDAAPSGGARDSAVATSSTRRIPPSEGRVDVSSSRQGPTRLSLSKTNVQASERYPSVLALIRRAQGVLQRNFSRQEWVVGVVQGVTHSRQGHLYFRLKDIDPTIGVEQAVLSVVIFGAAAQRILKTMAFHQLSLDEGVTVALCGEINIYAPRSSLQFIAHDVDVRVSRGEVELQRDRVIEALRHAGLSQRNAGMPLPLLPERIALVTSMHGDALHDVLRTFGRGHVGATVELLDVPVQGPGLESAVLGALQTLVERVEEFDLLLVVRGGGAANELAWWDNLAVCKALAEFPLPVIAGIGHERDESAVHEVTRFEATPTAAAQFVVELWARARRDVEQHGLRLTSFSQSVMQAHRTRLSRRGERFYRSTERLVQQSDVHLTYVLPDRIHARVTRAITRKSESLVRRRESIKRATDATQNRAHTRLQRSAEAFDEQTIARRLNKSNEQLNAYAERLRSRTKASVHTAGRELSLADSIVRASDPVRWLKRGYALVRDVEGAIVRDAAQLQADDRVDVQLAAGRFRGVVESTSVNDSASDPSNPKESS